MSSRDKTFAEVEKLVLDAINVLSGQDFKTLAEVDAWCDEHGTPERRR